MSSTPEQAISSLLLFRHKSSGDLYEARSLPGGEVSFAPQGGGFMHKTIETCATANDSPGPPRRG